MTKILIKLGNAGNAFKLIKGIHDQLVSMITLFFLLLFFCFLVRSTHNVGLKLNGPKIKSHMLY